MAKPALVSLTIQPAASSRRRTSLQIRLANNFWGRLVGLLAHSALSDDQGLLLVPCASIHTIGMRFSIDVVFLNRDNRVLGFADRVSPNRFRTAPKGTYKVLEISEGNRIRTGINLDDLLIFD